MRLVKKTTDNNLKDLLDCIVNNYFYKHIDVQRTIINQLVVHISQNGAEATNLVLKLTLINCIFY